MTLTLSPRPSVKNADSVNSGAKVARHAEKLVRDAFIWSHLAGDTVQRLKVAARLARVAAQH